MQPIVSGVYLLFLRHDLVYVGRSNDCYKRVAEHRTKGRDFDYSLVAACPASDVSWVEAALIASMDAKQNRIADRAARAAKVTALPAPSSPLTLAVGRAREHAAKCGVSNSDFNAAMERGDFPIFPRDPDKPRGAGSLRLVPLAALDAWCASQQRARIAG